MKPLEIALKEYGVKEIAGEKDNERILQYSHDVGMNWVNDDETPWCSIFMNWVCKQAGYERTNKATARSWLDIGTPILFPELGDIIVLKRGNSSWQGHVGIFIKQERSRVYVLGGNQSDQVKISFYNTLDILGFRRLTPLASF